MVRVFDNLIIDFESSINLNEINSNGLMLITCGLSQKSSVTASSIGDDCFLYCIQRGFKTHLGNMLLPQEFKVRWNKRHENIYPYLELVTAMLIIGLSPAEISDNICFCD